MAALALLFALFLLIATGMAGLVFMRQIDQSQRDRKRRTYGIVRATGTEAKNVINFIESLSGLKPRSRFTFSGMSNIALELWVTDKSLEYRIKVPYQDISYVLPQLEKYGFQAIDNLPFHEFDWTYVRELALVNTALPLDIRDLEDITHRIQSGFADRGLGEAMLMQTLIAPIARGDLPEHGTARSIKFGLSQFIFGNQAGRDEVNARRKKLSESNFAATIRLAGYAETKARARQLVTAVHRALDSTAGPGMWFHGRPLLLPGDLRIRLERAAQSPLGHGIQLSSTELAGLLAWPIGEYYVPGLPRPVARRFPTPTSVPTEGIVIGDASFTRQSRPVAIGYDEAMMHTFCLGRNGTGKTALLSHIARQVMEAGCGLVVVEAAGNNQDETLFQQVLHYVPHDRIDDVVLFDVADDRHPVGFNILDQGHPAIVIKEVMDLFKHMFGIDGMGIWAREYLKQGLRIITDVEGLTFIDIVRLLSPMTPDEVEWAKSVGQRIKDPELRRWWEAHEKRNRKDQDKRIEPALSRIYDLASPELRYILGQSQSTFQLRDVLEQNKILLVNLKGMNVDAGTASLIGTMLMTLLWHHAQHVSNKTTPTFVLLDEFSQFMDMAIDMDTVLAQARKYRLPMVLATQDMGPLPNSIKSAVVTNARNKIIFNSKRTDGDVLGKDMANQFNGEDVSNLPAREAIASLLTPAGPSGPVSIKTRAPKDQHSHASAILKQSEQKYGRAWSEVHEEISQRTAPERRPPSTRRPKISDWE
jgi:hypothetical protein